MNKLLGGGGLFSEVQQVWTCRVCVGGGGCLVPEQEPPPASLTDRQNDSQTRLNTLLSPFRWRAVINTLWWQCQETKKKETSFISKWSSPFAWSVIHFLPLCNIGCFWEKSLVYHLNLFFSAVLHHTVVFILPYTYHQTLLTFQVPVYYHNNLWFKALAEWKNCW